MIGILIYFFGLLINVKRMDVGVRGAVVPHLIWTDSFALIRWSRGCFKNGYMGVSVEPSIRDSYVNCGS